MINNHQRVDKTTPQTAQPSGLPGGEAVPEECFPTVPLPLVSAVTRWVSFGSEVTVLGTSLESDRLTDPEPVDRPDIQIHNPADPSFS